MAARIESGLWRPGQRLPTEPELAASFGVSRATLREALKSLQEDGFLTRTRGAGTYVTHRPRMKNNLDVNFGVTDLIRSMGMAPGTENLSVYEAAATATEAERLAIPPGSRVEVVERIRTADGGPVVSSRDVAPSSLLVGVDDLAARLRQGSIYDLLESAGIGVMQGVVSIKPLRADRIRASQLRVARGTLLLHLTQVDFDDLGRPVLLSYEYHLADAFEVTVVRRGPGRRGPRAQ
jgi:DNA-binding GntR family transcriptional regulator